MRTTGGGASGTVRNLRIREDTPKYLLNLDPNSAHYDPKSRSMREDPNPDKVRAPCVHADLAMAVAAEQEQAHPLRWWLAIPLCGLHIECWRQKLAAALLRNAHMPWSGCTSFCLPAATVTCCQVVWKMLARPVHPHLSLI